MTGKNLKKSGTVIFLTRNCPFRWLGRWKAFCWSSEAPKRTMTGSFCANTVPMTEKRLRKALPEDLVGKRSFGNPGRSSKGNGKSNLLFYVGGLGGNGITASFLNLMANADREHYNYFASFQTEHFKKIRCGWGFCRSLCGHPHVPGVVSHSFRGGSGSAFLSFPDKLRVCAQNA